MYLITTLLPGTSQQGGGDQGFGAQPIPSLINKMLPKELILRWAHNFPIAYSHI